MNVKYPVQLTEEELETICSALAVYLIAHRTDMEDSPFPATVDHSRREWLKATMLRDKLDPLTDEDDFFSDREANPHDGSMHGEPEGGYDEDEESDLPQPTLLGIGEEDEDEE